MPPKEGGGSSGWHSYYEPKELKRLHVIRKAIDKHIKQREAASLLELSERQIRRLVSAYAKN